MKSLTLLFIFTVLLFVQTNFCMAADYFPLEVGNVWYLGGRHGYPKYPTKYYIDKKIIVDGKEYYHMENHYYRKDDSGKVYRSPDVSSDEIPQSEFVMYDLSADIGDSWKFKVPGYDYTVTLESTTDVVETPAGSFYDCYRFKFIASDNVSDADFSAWLAPDVGLVTTWGTYITDLIKALVNGVKIETNLIYPQVRRTIPETGAVFDRYIRIFFTMEVNQNSLTTENFTMTSAKEGDFPFYIDLLPNYPNITIIYTNFVSLFPERPFAYDDTIYVNVSSAIEDYTGDHIQKDYSFFFITEKDTFTSLAEESKISPENFSLSNYPNPFNLVTTIEYSLSHNSYVTLTIFNVSGQVVSILNNEMQIVGNHSITWNAAGIPSGLYFYTLKANEFTEVKKMVLVK